MIDEHPARKAREDMVLHRNNELFVAAGIAFALRRQDVQVHSEPSSPPGPQGVTCESTAGSPERETTDPGYA